MTLDPVLSLRNSPLVVGLDSNGAGIRALCLSPVTILQPQVLGADTLLDASDLPRFWKQFVDQHSWVHGSLVIALAQSCNCGPVQHWVKAQGLAFETYPLVTPPSTLEFEVAALGLPEDFGPAFCAARTAIYRRLGGLIASHLWLEMLRLQDDLELSKGRLRRLMQAQLDTGPEFDLVPY